MVSLNAVEALGLTKRYGRVTACQGVNLLVPAGQIFGFLGPNGAGKSTVVKILLGLVPATQGTARLLGRPYHDREVHRRIGYLPELFRYPPWLSVHEVVDWHARVLGIASRRRAVIEALECVGLADRLHMRVKALSKGLQQRLGLAVAIVGDPDLLFLDEPTSAMDPVGRHEVGELLRAWRSRGKTIFLNSHLLAELEGLCDRVALIRQGRLLYTGGLDAILRAKSEFQVTTGPVPPACQRAWEQQGLVLCGGDGEWVYRGDRERLPELHALLARHRVAVYEVAPIHQSLESWFISSLQDTEEAQDAAHRTADHLGSPPA